MPQPIFRDRTEAGCLFVRRLVAYANRNNVFVLALPRRSIAGTFDAAKKLSVLFDVCVVENLGIPGQGELGFSAIVSGSRRVLNENLIRRLHLSEVALEMITRLKRQELKGLERFYRGGQEFQYWQRKRSSSWLTGASVKAAIEAIRQLSPKKIIVATPITSR